MAYMVDRVDYWTNIYGGINSQKISNVLDRQIVQRLGQTQYTVCKQSSELGYYWLVTSTVNCLWTDGIREEMLRQT